MLRLVMGAFVSSSDDEEDEEADQRKQQEQVSHGDLEELVDKTESELTTITSKPVDRHNLNGKMLKLKLASKRWICM